MKKRTIVLLLVLTALYSCLSAEDKIYQVNSAYESDDRGQVFNQRPFSGQIILYENGTYRVSLHIQDEGTYKYSRASSQQPNDMILFYSNKKYQYFAYPRTGMLAIWLNKTPQGLNQWVIAVPVGATTPPAVQPDAVAPATPATPATPSSPNGSIKNGLFAVVVMYSTTSAPSYSWYNKDTGSFRSDMQGIIFRPNGTYYLKANFGGMEMEEKGYYTISGDTIRVRFDDGSAMDLKIMKGGQTLHYYSSGMLLSEFFFLGAVK